MGIDVVWLNAPGEQRGLIADSSSVLSIAIQRVRDGRSRRHLLVSAIDPYGNTRFSSGQAPKLLRKFEELRSLAKDPLERIVIGHVLSVPRAVEGTPDEWLDFVGD